MAVDVVCEMVKRPRIGWTVVIAATGLSTVFTWCDNAHGAAIVETETFSDETVVIAIKSLQGLGIARDNIPGTVWMLTSSDFDRNHLSSPLEVLAQQVPGMSLNDVQGDAMVQDLNYRGFTASPLQGTPQGLAVYQGGVRLNEVLGDTVNWDLIPQQAIYTVDIWSTHPVYGLNALGGAINITMKNGFVWQGSTVEVSGGSHQLGTLTLQYGKQADNLALYVAADGWRDGGWRYHSNADIERLYSDTGYRNGTTELHVIVSAARSSLGVVGPTPIELVEHDSRAVYTSPQLTKNRMEMVSLEGTHRLAPDWEIKGKAYFRQVRQSHVDGNSSDLEACDTDTSFPGYACLESDGFGTSVSADSFVVLGPNGAPVPFDSNVPYGVVDNTATNNRTFGGVVQLTSKRSLWRHDNRLSAGMSVDYGKVRFNSSSTLGFIFPDLSVGSNPDVAAAGSIIRTAGNIGYVPVDFEGRSTYVGLFALNSVDIASRLTVTTGARANFAYLSTHDVSGVAPELDGNHAYRRVNLSAGFTYAFAPAATLYAGYAGANRAPTPVELSCADPLRPCLLENALVSDPPLKQVTARSFEIGMRGKLVASEVAFDWSIAAFRIDNRDDIVSLASPIQGRNYYANVPGTRRQGFETNFTYQLKNWSAYANYSFVDATYRFSGATASPNNPSADAIGDIFVRPGDHLPAIPMHQGRCGLEYEMSQALKIGIALRIIGSQYFAGDNANQNTKLPAYTVTNFNAAYRMTESIQAFGAINNLFNRNYATYGTYFDTGGVARAGTFSLSDSRMITRASPMSATIGMKMTF